MIISIRKLSTTIIRCNINSRDPVRVRFAPSPTGSIHFGGLRTALYNYIFARQNNGSFIIRIEDTDQTRIVPESRSEIERVLEWSGLSPHESPSRGGNYGPYVQSERLEIYKKHSYNLLRSSKAYRCFCSPTRLDLLRKNQSKNREKPQYDGKCKHLTESDINAKLKANEPFTIRFSLLPGVISFEDMIYGHIETDLKTSKESDPIIIKSDAWPTYHFANVVDDHEMKISHVFRGSEWIPSTAKHIQLYQAFGWKIPTFAHLPLITMKDGSKMSKRKEDCQIESWINRGYQPLSLLNMLTNMSGGLPKEKQDAMEIWDLETIIENFDFQKVVSHPASIDTHKLNRFNSLVMTKIWNENAQLLVVQCKTVLSQNGYSNPYDDYQLRQILSYLIGDRITTVQDIISDQYSYLWNFPKLQWLHDSESIEEGCDIKNIISDVISILNEKTEQLPENEKESLTNGLKNLATKHSLGYGKFMKLIRLLLTDKSSGQPVYDVIQCIGKSRTLEYLKHCSERIK